MIIFDLDVKDRLEEIRKNHFQVKQIKESLAYNRDKYRELTTALSIEQESLTVCCDYFERSLLINCYTFAEQLVKNFVYEILEKDRHVNIFLNTFLNSKIPKEKFSPNVLMSKIEELVKKELFKDFKFTFPFSHESLKKYDEMIKSRHKYAHNGIYDFNFDNFDDVIKVLELISFELNMTLGRPRSVSRKDYQKKLSLIKTESINICKKVNLDNDVRAYKKDLKKIKDNCKKFTLAYFEEMKDIELLVPLIEKVKEVTKIDLRNSRKSALRILELKEYLSI